VRFDRPRAQVKANRHFFVRQALGEQREHFAFTLSKIDVGRSRPTLADRFSRSHSSNGRFKAWASFCQDVESGYKSVRRSFPVRSSAKRNAKSRDLHRVASRYHNIEACLWEFDAWIQPRKHSESRSELRCVLDVDDTRSRKRGFRIISQLGCVLVI
jgi:hypothetical protein